MLAAILARCRGRPTPSRRALHSPKAGVASWRISSSDRGGVRCGSRSRAAICPSPTTCGSTSPSALGKVARQVSELASSRSRCSRSAIPAIADTQVAEATLHLKGVTLRARDASPDMLHSINLWCDELARPGQAPPRQTPQAARGARGGRRGATGRADRPGRGALRLDRSAPRAGASRGRRASRSGGCDRPPRRSYPSPMSILDRALRMGEAKKFKVYEQRVGAINAFEPELEHYTDAELRERGRAARARRRRREPRRSAVRVLRARARGGQAHDGDAPLRRPADRRHGAPRRRDRRDEDRRGQDADGDAGGRPELARRTDRGPTRAAAQGRPRGDRQRLPGPPRRRVDEADLRRARGHRRGAAEHAALRGEARRLRAPTSPTGPTPSSASTTCATTWPRTSPKRSSAGATRPTRSSTRSTTS